MLTLFVYLCAEASNMRCLVGDVACRKYAGFCTGYLHLGERRIELDDEGAKVFDGCGGVRATCQTCESDGEHAGVGVGDLEEVRISVGALGVLPHSPLVREPTLLGSRA